MKSINVNDKITLSSLFRIMPSLINIAPNNITFTIVGGGCTTKLSVSEDECILDYLTIFETMHSRGNIISPYYFVLERTKVYIGEWDTPESLGMKNGDNIRITGNRYYN
jgi:hypothetical protein